MTEKQIEHYFVEKGQRRYPDVVHRFRPDRITEWDRKNRTVRITAANGVILKITVCTPNIIRLHYALRGDNDPDFSYSIAPEFEEGYHEFAVEEEADEIRIVTSRLTCKVQRERMLVSFHDKNGKLICRDKNGYYRRESLTHGISEIRITHEAPSGTRYYGLGDKAHEPDLRGRSFENWNTDSFGYERGDDPLYRSIPFYIALNEVRGYGIFLDNTYPTIFDFDRRKNGTTRFSAKGGQMNYYFINGPGLPDVARRYTRLTGTPELPPIWALGYHQCRWSYYPESRVREIAHTFREKNIPCDAIYLDIDYMKDYKVFTWNPEHFPDPKKLIEDLKEDGFRTIVMVDPGIRIDDEYTVFTEGISRGYFCTRPDGELFIGPVWPPRCVWPDFTDPEVRDWWGELYQEFISDLQVDGIWNDMNEPAVFELNSKTFPDDIRHNHDGHHCSHLKAHNIYGMQMARATLDGIKKHAPDKRPFLLTRAAFSGGQRYAALWTGDNIASWDHLRLAHEQCLRLSISGFSFCGSDIGGFSETPSPELYTRWLQLGIFHPLFRTHSMGYNVDGAAAVQAEAMQSIEKTGNQEPWSFGDRTTEIARETIGLRYRLLNYLYSAFREYVVNGTPVIKPLVFYDQTDTQTARRKDEFLFGDRILVSPVLRKGQKTKSVYLPEGSWYHFWDDQLYEGKSAYKVESPLHRIPLFVKGGSVLPLREAMQYTGEIKPDKLSLLVYHSESSGECLFYEDEEEGYGYRNGNYRTTEFRYRSELSERRVRLIAQRNGPYRPPYRHIEYIFIGLLPGMEVTQCMIDGTHGEFETIERNGRPAIRVTTGPEVEEVVLSY